MANDQRMIDAQARRISKLNDIVYSKNEEILKLEHRLYKYELAGKFYLEMQKLILDNLTLKAEWDRFCIVLKLANPDIEEIFNHIITRDIE